MLRAKVEMRHKSHLWTTVKLHWQLLKRDPRQMNTKPTQEMTFLIGRTKILRLLPFQDLGGQYVPIFGLISKVGLQRADMFHVSQEKTYLVYNSLPNAPVWASAIFPDLFIPANHD